MTRHRWSEKRRFEHKTEQTCSRCEIVKVSRRESEGGRDVYWDEFWRGLDKIEGEGTPICEPAKVDA